MMVSVNTKLHPIKSAITSQKPIATASRNGKQRDPKARIFLFESMKRLPRVELVTQIV